MQCRLTSSSQTISETMDILKNQPSATEVCVTKVHPLRFAAQESQEKYEQFFQNFNNAMMAAAEQHQN